MDHVYSFMLAEMGTTGSIDASSRMVIKGRFPPKAIEQIIRRYVGEYVSCASCKSPATALQKQNRLYFMQVWARGMHACIEGAKAVLKWCTFMTARLLCTLRGCSPPLAAKLYPHLSLDRQYTNHGRSPYPATRPRTCSDLPPSLLLRIVHHPPVVLAGEQCNNCGARRSVAPIKTGFVAISRGARKKNRA